MSETGLVEALPFDGAGARFGSDVGLLPSLRDVQTHVGIVWNSKLNRRARVKTMACREIFLMRESPVLMRLTSI
jgi:hypothetical protein